MKPFRQLFHSKISGLTLKTYQGEVVLCLSSGWKAFKVKRAQEWMSFIDNNLTPIKKTAKSKRLELFAD